MLDRQTQTDLGMAQVQNNLVMEIMWGLQVTQERDQALSRENQLTSLRLALTWVTSQMAEFRSQHSTISKEATTPVSEIQTQGTSYSEGLSALAKRLEVISLRQASAMIALDEYRASEGEHWRDREKELMTHLCPKVTSFF